MQNVTYLQKNVSTLYICLAPSCEKRDKNVLTKVSCIIELCKHEITKFCFKTMDGHFWPTRNYTTKKYRIYIYMVQPFSPICVALRTNLHYFHLVVEVLDYRTGPKMSVSVSPTTYSVDRNICLYICLVVDMPTRSWTYLKKRPNS